MKYSECILICNIFIAAAAVAPDRIKGLLAIILAITWLAAAQFAAR